MGLMIAFKEFEFFYFTLFFFALRCCSIYPCSRLSFHRKIKLPQPLYVTHEWAFEWTKNGRLAAPDTCEQDFNIWHTNNEYQFCDI